MSTIGIDTLSRKLSYKLNENDDSAKIEQDRIDYKKELESLQKSVLSAYNFLHEASQELKFNEINDYLTNLEKKFPNKRSQVRSLEGKMSKIRQYRMQFEDSYYQLKSEISKFLK